LKKISVETDELMIQGDEASIQIWFLSDIHVCFYLLSYGHDATVYA
jgi:hypothetical protein